MSEQEKKQPGEAQEAQVGEVSVDDLNRKVRELAKIESELFGGDGKISNYFSNYENLTESNDTEIDQRFKEFIKQGQDIKTKIDIVTSLILEFSNQQYDYHKGEEYKKYTTPETYRLIDDFKEKINILQSQEPYKAYTEIINLILINDLNGLKMATDYLENKQPDQITYIINTFYDKYDFEFIKGLIDYIHNNEKIVGADGKRNFLRSYVQNVSYFSGYKDIDTIMSLEIYNTKEYIYGESIDSLNDDYSLIGLLGVHIDHLKDINTLYLDGLREIGVTTLSKNNLNFLNNDTAAFFGKLVDFIDKNFDTFNKRKIFKLGIIEDIYINYKKTFSCIINSADLSNDDILDLSEISNQNFAHKTELLLGKFYILEKDKINNKNTVSEQIEILKSFSEMFFTNENNNIQDKLAMYKIWKKISGTCLKGINPKDTNNIDQLLDSMEGTEKK